MRERGYMVWLAVIVSIFMLLTYIPGTTLTKTAVATDSGSVVKVQAFSSDPTVIATIPLEKDMVPGNIAVNPATNRIYVANNNINSTYNDSNISVIDGFTNNVIATIKDLGRIVSIAVNPETNRIYVANIKSVLVIDGITNSIVATINVNSGDIAVNPKTNRIYVASGGSINVSIIDGATNDVVATVAVGFFPLLGSIAVNPNTNRIYMGNRSAVSVIDGITNSIVATINSVGSGNLPSSSGIISVNPNTNHIYVTDYYYNSVSVIDGSSNTVIAKVGLAQKSGGIAVNPNTNRIFVTNFFDDTVSVIDGSTNSSITSVKVGSSPGAIEVNPNTNRIYVVNTGIAVDPNTNSILDFNYGSKSVSVIQDGLITGIVASSPVPTGGLNEYALSLQIVSTSDSRFSIGQQVWCAAKSTDFPDLLTVGATLAGTLDNSLGWWVLKPGAVTPPPAIPTITGTVASVPVPTGGLNEYALSILIVSTSDSRFSIGQQVWCAAKTTDFPDLLAAGATLTGMLDNSLGWWILKPGAATPPPTIPTVTGTVASMPVPTGGLNEYALSILIVGTSDSRFSIGQKVWCAAKTTDFSDLLTVGATLTGTLDNSSGWWVLKPGAVTPPPTIPTITGTVAIVPVPTGGLNEYALSLQIVSSSDPRFSIGQQVWCAGSTTDFPGLLTVGVALTGNLDNSLGWWIFKKI